MVQNFDIARGELENGNDVVVEISQKDNYFTVIGYIRGYTKGSVDLALFNKKFDDLADAKEFFAKVKEMIVF